jgi:hypothetical protein
LVGSFAFCPCFQYAPAIVDLAAAFGWFPSQLLGNVGHLWMQLFVAKPDVEMFL